MEGKEVFLFTAIHKEFYPKKNLNFSSKPPSSPIVQIMSLMPALNVRLQCSSQRSCLQSQKLRSLMRV